MISSISVENFRVLGKIGCGLEPLTIVIGPNGCGKSTLLEVLASAASWMYPGGAPGIPFLPQPATQVEVSSDAETFLMYAEGRKQWRQKGGPWREGHPPLKQPLQAVLHLTLRTDLLRSESPGTTPVGLLQREGQGLAAMIADMKLKDDPRLDRINDRLRAIVPNVQRVRTTRDPARNSFSLVFDTSTGEVPARFMSEGTMQALGLLTGLAGVEGQRAFVVIDDLEKDLHPKAQRELVESILAMKLADQGVQLVGSSHSPYLLDCVPPESVRIMCLGDDGYARIASLTDHPEYSRWKEVMAPGEFWSSVGEAWVGQQASAGASGS